MAEDVLRLGVRFGLLMKLLHAGHLPSGLGDLDPVADECGPAVHAEYAGVDPKYQIAP